MRSKEVDKSIKSLENFVNQKYYNGVTAKEMKTVLSYISELEEKSKKCEYYESVADALYKDSISKDKIRDKIKELDDIIYYAGTEEGMCELKDFEYDRAKYGIEILKELLGE